MPAVKRDLRVRNIPAMIHWTSVLLKFCEDHGHSVAFLERLKECIVALEKRNIDEALEVYKGLSTARMGSFIDWVPTPLQGETETYAVAVFGSLYGSWLEAMDRSAFQ